MARYYATALRGLEGIVRREIVGRLPGADLVYLEPDRQNVSRETFVRNSTPPSPASPPRGRIHFDYTGAPTAALRLRSVENVFAAVAQFEGLAPDDTGLRTIRSWVASCDLGEALAVHAAIHGPREDASFRCTSKRTGQHLYGSMEIVAAAGAGVVDRYGWRVDLEGYDYDLHVDVEDDRCTIGLRLTPENLGRRGRVVHAAASVNPTLAYAMCVLSDPQPGEVFIDPTCGAGTVLLERAALGPARLIAGDLFPRAVDLARRNLEANDVQARLCRWDARRLPLASESVDKFCANLPWGRRAGSHTVNKHLYPPLVREIARTLRVGGLAILVSLEKRLLTHCVERHGWLRVADMLPVSVGGLEPAIYVVRKGRGQERPPEA